MSITGSKTAIEIYQQKIKLFILLLLDNTDHYQTLDLEMGKNAQKLFRNG